MKNVSGLQIYQHALSNKCIGIHLNNWTHPPYIYKHALSNDCIAGYYIVYDQLDTASISTSRKFVK